mgnify:FL=1
MGKREQSARPKGRGISWRYAALAAGIAVLAAAVVLLVTQRSSAGKLAGTWIYNSSVSYTFDGEAAGAMYDRGQAYEFAYKARGDKLTLTFADQMLETAHYQFAVNGSVLTLTGGEGTAGGVYQLVFLSEDEA